MIRANLSKSFDRSSRVGGFGVGAKLSPLESTEAASSESFREDRFVICLRNLSLLILL